MFFISFTSKEAPAELSTFSIFEDVWDLNQAIFDTTEIMRFESIDEAMAYWQSAPRDDDSLLSFNITHESALQDDAEFVDGVFPSKK